MIKKILLSAILAISLIKTNTTLVWDENKKQAFYQISIDAILESLKSKVELGKITQPEMDQVTQELEVKIKEQKINERATIKNLSLGILTVALEAIEEKEGENGKIISLLSENNNEENEKIIACINDKTTKLLIEEKKDKKENNDNEEKDNLIAEQKKELMEAQDKVNKAQNEYDDAVKVESELNQQFQDAKNEEENENENEEENNLETKKQVLETLKIDLENAETEFQTAENEENKKKQELSTLEAEFKAKESQSSIALKKKNEADEKLNEFKDIDRDALTAGRDRVREKIKTKKSEIEALIKNKLTGDYNKEKFEDLKLILKNQEEIVEILKDISDLEKQMEKAEEEKIKILESINKKEKNSVIDKIDKQIRNNSRIIIGKNRKLKAKGIKEYELEKDIQSAEKKIEDLNKFFSEEKVKGLDYQIKVLSVSHSSIEKKIEEIAKAEQEKKAAMSQLVKKDDEYMKAVDKKNKFLKENKIDEIELNTVKLRDERDSLQNRVNKLSAEIDSEEKKSIDNLAILLKNAQAITKKKNNELEEDKENLEKLKNKYKAKPESRTQTQIKPQPQLNSQPETDPKTRAIDQPETDPKTGTNSQAQSKPQPTKVSTTAVKKEEVPSSQTQGQIQKSQPQSLNLTQPSDAVGKGGENKQDNRTDTLDDQREEPGHRTDQDPTQPEGQGEQDEKVDNQNVQVNSSGNNPTSKTDKPKNNKFWWWVLGGLAVAIIGGIIWYLYGKSKNLK